MARGGLKGIAKGRSDIFRVDPNELYVKSGWNGRDFDDPENQAHVEMLADSIAAIGVKEALTVVWEDDRAWVINGECRLRAVKLAISRGVDIVSVPVQTEDRFSNDADRLFSQIIRNNGKPFSGMEQARVFKRLLDLGWQQSDIASKAGLTPGRVSQIMNLLTMPEAVKAMVTTGQVSAAMAQRTLATAPTQQAAVQVLKDAVITAKAEGKHRASPKHLSGGSSSKQDDDSDIEIIDDIMMIDGSDATPHKDSHRDVGKIVFDAFEYAKVDDEVADEKGHPVVVITMPLKHWEKIRKALKL